MKNYISTYFYHDSEESGASYGNIFLPLDERNIVYWQTVYSLLYSSLVTNKHGVELVLFTNYSTFPFRSEIENLGVKVYDDLVLTSRNNGKWATVKFFFDVIDFINHSTDFSNDDAFVMLDTDVISLHSSLPLFDKLRATSEVFAYVFDEHRESNDEFHGMTIAELESIFRREFGKVSKINQLVGGEFFAFIKKDIAAFNVDFSTFRDANYDGTITTEEQVLTLVHAKKPWAVFSHSIYRVWTTLRFFDIPSNFRDYIFLHLPSEKEGGLALIFQELKGRNPGTMSSEEFYKIFTRCVPLHRPLYLYMLKLINKIRAYAF